MPTEHEITTIVFSIHPDRAAGPDGVNARFIQTQWSLVKACVLKQINDFFFTKVMCPDVAKSNLVLVPKKEVPQMVVDYRPISVCNITYKIISKLLSRRLQPFIATLVLPNQSAFTPGRQIGDNVMVFREVIHSFSLSTYNKASFCLKVDLSKAFDKLSWPYIFSVLEMYGLPRNYIDWVKACVTSARFAILINGAADGFIKPTRGVRQGCSLSPYLFILALDVLSRYLQFMVQKREIKGVQLARGAPVLTNLMYADDLLILGEATYQEIATISVALNMFCNISGQQIGANKSRIWFSKHTPQDIRLFVMHTFDATVASSFDIYLGSPVVANRGSDFTPLLSKIEGKLQGWKSQFLSQAGKVVLIKSVIEPTLHYAMSTTCIPKGVLQKIQNMIRKFFWCKGSQQRIPLVAWKHITQPKSKGGLGLRDVHMLNKSFSLKALWAVATRAPNIWVQIVTAKYLCRCSIWDTKRTHKCTAMWRGILASRMYLNKLMRWQIGDGKTCRALGDPWHDMWQHFQPSNKLQRGIVVAELVSHDGSWNISKLLHNFGFSGALYLAMHFPHGPGLNSHADRPIFIAAKNGKFTLKGAYAAISSVEHIHTISPQFQALVQRIWKCKGLLPKIRIFLWKVLRAALPVDQVFVTRMGKQPQGCLVCGHHTEDITHTLFKCQMVRTIWLSSILGLRTDDLPDDILQLLEILFSPTDDTLLNQLANVLWCYWKARCKMIFEGTSIKRERVLAEAEGLRNLTLLSHDVHGSKRTYEQTREKDTDYTCYVDGSWINEMENGAGVGYVLFTKDNNLVQYQMAVTQAFSPLHAEILAFKTTVQAVSHGNFIPCTINTDCNLLYRVITGAESVDSVDWRAYRDLLDVIRAVKECKNIGCNFINRENNHMADGLARQARIKRIDAFGYTFPIM
ncbi:RNA-directed DNA polymerase (reverse transcriptase)-related family protein [Rhynchospora pubera]|uniref:RNA-directed DNA polymerase (Reverse transcriptase)-related family protein n=1 Tax=Rhynchospora pubera TaxID=906938 RepID=A0AAV8F974_9POAL|nr:RNA-directed DNA polymerase (reverse transcriptase)-related family protein [Rhynchospora pubera]